MLSKRKKIFILSGMLTLLVATAVVNVLINNSLKAVSGGGGQANFFDGLRTERSATRSETVLYYDSIINSASATEAERAAALTEKSALIATGEKETIIEALVKSMGFTECFVTLGANVNVIVKTAEMLTDAEVARILSDTMRESGKPATSIRVIPVE
ncbi:MAG: SpoIIIAH-like family protein [Firmicutes bacterium]|nr:SpoIIIAH-like family protein [Bacillota bacterium]